MTQHEGRMRWDGHETWYEVVVTSIPRPRRRRS